MIEKFSHITGNKATMVDVSHKKKTIREAHGYGKIKFQKNTFLKVKENNLKKGEIFSTARIASIQAAKKTSDLIPLCHNIKINFISVEFNFSERDNSIIINSIVKTTENTGVEMEALTAVNIAALTIYDMCKSLDKNIEISQIKLKYKSGGKSGKYINDSI
ncbi:cyclic pyranopterin monophosphate synthase MoaC [Rickettsiales bacterium]|nr:cyclic pyranopterin monophosphate synthase MoaC [Rickettsiales bacterium]